MKKSLVVMIMAALVASAFVAPAADAKKKKKKKKPAACAAYVPGEQGADLETVVVTDAATEEAPVEVEVTAPQGLRLGFPTDDATGGGENYYNVQVDSASKEKGLYVRLEWSAPQNAWDYDLYVRNPDGTDAANAHGFNPAYDSEFSPVSDGGHTEGTAEQVDGLKTADCQGYTAAVSTASGPGGTMVLKYWLGDVQFDGLPAAE